jgi:hypothetical protein
MAGIFSSSSGGMFPTATAAPKAGGSDSAGGLLGHLFGDVKNAVTGFVPGMVHMAEHPIGGVEAMGKGMWSTWSPLFHGQFTKFGQGIYQHPLAPILDVAAIASLGLNAAADTGAAADAMAISGDTLAEQGLSRAGAVARAVRTGYAPGGQLAKDAEMLGRGEKMIPANNMLHSAARLKLPRSKTVFDPAATGDNGRGFQLSHYSQRPMRRLFQEQAAPRIGAAIEKVSPGTKSMLDNANFSRMLYREMARRSVMANAVKLSNLEAGARAEAIGAARTGRMTILDATMLAGKSLMDPTSAARVRQELAAGMHLNLGANAPVALPYDEAVKFLKENPHFRPVKAPGAMNGAYQSQLAKAGSKLDRLRKASLKNAGLAQALPKIEEELAHHNATLKDYADNGYLHTQTPALNSKGEPAVNPTPRQSMEQHAQPILEVQRNIKMLDRLQRKAIKAKAAWDDAQSKIPDLAAQHADLQNRSFAEYYSHVASSEESFNNFTNNFGRHAVLGFKKGNEDSIKRALDKAWVGGDGLIKIVPRHDATMLGQELRGSVGFASKAYSNTTGLWKSIQVKFTPKTVVNNTLANHVLYAFRMMDPATSYRALLHATRLAKGSDEAASTLMRATPWRNKSWLLQNFEVELHNNFRAGVEEDLTRGTTRKAATRLGRFFHGPGMYSLVQKAADEPVRLGAINAYVHSDPEVQAYADTLIKKASGRGARLSRSEALDRSASRLLRNRPDLKFRAAEYGRSVAGDYLSQTPLERQIKNWVPFYLWDRHILKSASALFKDTPGRVAVLQQMSHMGQGEVQKYLGAMPSFLQDALPLQELGLSGKGPNGRMDAIVGPSLNPFGTLGEVSDLAQAATTNKPIGSDLFSQLNPLVTGTIEAMSGKSLLTGTAVKSYGGVPTTVAMNILQGFPEYKLISAAVNKPVELTASGKYQKLYRQDEKTAISNFLGIPIKEISPSGAQYQYAQEHPVPKKKKLSSMA